MPIEFKCKDCGQPLAVEEKHAGELRVCPKCDACIVVPDESDPPLATKGKMQNVDRDFTNCMKYSVFAFALTRRGKGYASAIQTVGKSL